MKTYRFEPANRNIAFMKQPSGSCSPQTTNHRTVIRSVLRSRMVNIDRSYLLAGFLYTE